MELHLNQYCAVSHLRPKLYLNREEEPIADRHATRIYFFETLMAE